jgi:hypothetical protein
VRKHKPLGELNDTEHRLSLNTVKNNIIFLANHQLEGMSSEFASKKRKELMDPLSELHGKLMMIINDENH